MQIESSVSKSEIFALKSYRYRSEQKWTGSIQMKIDISQRQTLEFLIEVDGTDIDEVKSRLVLFENDLMIGFNGETSIQKDGQTKLSFIVPELKNIIKSQNVSAKIEMFVENRFYVPYETSIEIERPVVFKVNESKVESNKSPFAVRDAKIITEKKETPKPKPKPQLRVESKTTPEPVNESSFNFDRLLSDFETHGDFDQLKLKTIHEIQNHSVYASLSEDSKEKVAVLKSKRVKTEELYFKIMKGILGEMFDCGVKVILE
jgi:hypothetical protein